MPPQRPHDDQHARRRPSAGWWVLAFLALVFIVGGVIALARGESTDSNIDATGAQPTAASPASTVAPTDPTIPPTAAATTPPPTEAPPTTPPPATEPVGPAELIPGFLATDDIEQFIDQLRGPQSTAGKQSRKLGDGLRDVLKEDGENRSKEIRDVLEKIDEWLDKEEIDPTVAARAVAFLADLDTGGQGDGDDD